METRLSSLSICGLILILLPLTFSTSPATYRSRHETTPECLKDKIPLWEKMMCGFISKQENQTDTNNHPIKRKVQLYSRASQLHVQIKKTAMDASGEDGSQYARLVLESDNFGRIKIRGEKTNRYLCFNKKGELVPRAKKQRFATMKRCIFREEMTGEGWLQYRSVKYPDWLIGFSKGGRPMNGNRSAQRSKYREFTVRKLERRKRKHLRDAKLLRIKIIRLLRKKFHLR